MLGNIGETKDLSQEELAHRADIDRTYISSLERSRYAASIDVVDRLARVLGVEAADLLQRPARSRRRTQLISSLSKINPLRPCDRPLRTHRSLAPAFDRRRRMGVPLPSVGSRAIARQRCRATEPPVASRPIRVTPAHAELAARLGAQ